MKQRMMFMVINMNLGGTEKALLNMIDALPADQFDITVLLLERRGSLLDAIPDHVHVAELEQYQAIKHLIHQSRVSPYVN
ncbi:hypothetical protein JNUCC1_00708 [Lentibacillus sp. JNUCC-1]|uniref:hypothetical protein n=1 Tax=Lentibacillus sp. JNUCC-1 TaxID=2654513 RepID=UPI0012E731CC|nr:hypothetical protein [Lentibacillus sp. JNUCC-1]MUV36904.1 hypothetical protein [Lentibacillus sp. JNUCC-1]